MSYRIIEGDCLTRLAELPAESVQCCITSPPYWGLRDYGADGQLGLEPTPEEYVANLVAVFREVKRVLRDDGTLWLNLGDSYAGAGKGPSNEGKPARNMSNTAAAPNRWQSVPAGIKGKDLVGIPWMVAFALRADGWYLRSDIIWHKPNPMPESVTDRPTKSHEYLFLLSKGPRYFYDADAIREEDLGADNDHRNVLVAPEPTGGLMPEHSGLRTVNGRNGAGRNKRSVWTVTTQPFAEAHFATFPPKLIEPCILAGTPPKCCGECGAPWERVTEGGEGTYAKRKALGHDKPQNMVVGGHPGHHNGIHPEGMTHDVTPAPKVTIGWRSTCSHDDDSGIPTVLDPFSGAGTTGLVATRHNRGYIGIELNPEYAQMSRNRIHDDAPLLNVDLAA